MTCPLRCIFLTMIYLAAGALMATYPILAQAQPVPVDLELILAVDVSGSVDEEEARLQRQAGARLDADR